jgi:hypothetical protein
MDCGATTIEQVGRSIVLVHPGASPMANQQACDADMLALTCLPQSDVFVPVTSKTHL